MKLLAITITISILLMPFGGCARFSLDERSIVEGIAIDATDNGFLITTQIYKQSKNDKGSEKYEIHTASGNTVYDALQNITHTSGKHPFYSYNKIIIISYKTLFVGLNNILDYFIRDNEIRHNTLVCCSQGDASEMLKIKNEGQLMPAERITTLLGIAGLPTYKTASAELLEVGTRLKDECTDIYLPYIKLREEDKGKVAYSEGSVAFKNDRPICILSSSEQLGFCYINGYSTHYPLTVEYDNSKFIFSLKKVDKNTNIKPNNKSGFDFNTEFKVNAILEEVYSNGKKFNDDQINQATMLLGEKICQISSEATHRILVQHKSDIFQYGAHIRQRFPKQYNKLSSWYDIIDNCSFKFTHKVTLSRVGENNP